MPQLPVVPAQRFRTTRTISALFIREMSTTYGRSAIGYIWAVLEPVAGVALLTAVFSLAFKSPSLGISFPLFYATGMVPFTAYLDISQKVSLSLRFSKQLLFYPGVTFLDALLARFLLNAITQFLVFIIVIGGIILVYDLQVILDVPSLALGFGLALLLALGVGTLNCFLLSSFPIWERLWAVITRPLFIVSGVFFILESVPQPFQDLLWWNPLVHVIGLIRKGVYSTYDASYASPTYVISVSAVCFGMGLITLRRYNRDIINF